LKVIFKVKNTGKKDGAEIIQLYLNHPDHKEDRPEKELKAFDKIYLKAGEEKLVEFILPESSFQFFSNDTNKWEMGSGNYNLLIGSSSRVIKLQKSIFR